MNIVELFYLIGFVLCAVALGALLAKSFGMSGWVIGGIVGLMAWGGVLWCIKRFCNKLAAKRTRTKLPGSGNKET